MSVDHITSPSVAPVSQTISPLGSITRLAFVAKTRRPSTRKGNRSLNERWWHTGPSLCTEEKSRESNGPHVSGENHFVQFAGGTFLRSTTASVSCVRPVWNCTERSRRSKETWAWRLRSLRMPVTGSTYDSRSVVCLRNLEGPRTTATIRGNTPALSASSADLFPRANLSQKVGLM